MKKRKCFAQLAAWCLAGLAVSALIGCGPAAPMGEAETTGPPEYGALPQQVVSARPEVWIPVPLIRQARDYTCGVACTAAVLRYAGYDYDTREDVLAIRLGASEAEGTNVDAIVDYLNAVRYEGEDQPSFLAQKREGMTTQDLLSCLNEGKPVFLLIQAWAENPQGLPSTDQEYANEWDSGHYVVAVGYDDERVYFMDPSTSGNYTYIPTAELDARWHDSDEELGRVDHLGIVIEVARPKYRPDLYYKLL